MTSTPSGGRGSWCRPAPRSSGAPQDAQVAASGSLKCALRQLTPSTISTSPGRGGAGVPDGAVPTGSGARRPAVGSCRRPAAEPHAAKRRRRPQHRLARGHRLLRQTLRCPRGGCLPWWLGYRDRRLGCRHRRPGHRHSRLGYRCRRLGHRLGHRLRDRRTGAVRRRLQGHAPTGHRALPEVERHRRRSVCGGSTRAGDRDRVVRRVDPALQPGQGLRGVEGLGLRAVDAHRDVAVDQDEQRPAGPEQQREVRHLLGLCLGEQPCRVTDPTATGGVGTALVHRQQLERPVMLCRRHRGQHEHRVVVPVDDSGPGVDLDPRPRGRDRAGAVRLRRSGHGARARSRLTAALMRARWVKACGKLPKASPDGPISSA